MRASIKMLLLVAAALAVSGAVMQSVLQNPLASPFGPGVSSGAGLGASLVIVLGLADAGLGTFLLPAVSPGFALGTVFLVVLVASRLDRGMSNVTIILCLALISALTACGANRFGKDRRAEDEASALESTQAAFESAYASGYVDGFEAGHASAGAASEPAESSGQEVPAKPVDSAELSGFVVLSEAVPDVILEIRYYSTYNFVGERINGYNEPVALLTKEAASALKEASDELLRQGYQLKIYDAYRPQSAVDHFKAWALDPEDARMKAYFYPELDKSALFAQGYIASKSGHSRGSTVDVTLVDRATGRDVDMGGPFDYFGELSHPGYTTGLTEEQAGNRGILRAAMLAHGFRGIGTEWWHFTLEDEPYPDTYFDFPVESFD